MTVPPIVSFDDEPLVLVNDADEEVGSATKERCHAWLKIAWARVRAASSLR